MRTIKIIFITAFALIPLAHSVVTFEVQAQEDPADRQLALARICASEEGLARLTDGCAAIDAVITYRAERRGVSWMRQARDGSRRSFNQRRRDNRRWIAFLSPSGEQPEGWPAFAWQRAIVEGDDGEPREMMRQVRHAPWSTPDRGDDFQRRWLRIYEHAGRIVSGEVQGRCEVEGRVTPVHYWGCRPDPRGQCRDYERAERAGWTEVTCGDARNMFFCDPRVSRSCPRREEAEEMFGG
jgi:hypothetical protein